MATFVKRATGRWQARIRRDFFPAISKTFASRKEAEIWARQIEGDIDTGGYQNVASIKGVTLADLLERYLLEVTPHKRSARGERSKLKNYLNHPLVKRPLSVITPRDMAELRDWRLRSVSPGSVLREFCVIRNAYEVARRDWFMPIQNPVSEIRLPLANPHRERRLLPGEEDRLMIEAKKYGSNIALVIQWLLETAMRREEAASLSPQHICLSSTTAHVVRSKNGFGRRVPLSESAVDVYEAALSAMSGESIFGMRPDSITQAFSRVCKRAGISGLHVHDLRHEATSRFVEMGLSMPEVMAITGHRDPRIMLKYYSPQPHLLVQRIRGQ